MLVELKDKCIIFYMSYNYNTLSPVEINNLFDRLKIYWLINQSYIFMDENLQINYKTCYDSINFNFKELNQNQVISKLENYYDSNIFNNFPNISNILTLKIETIKNTDLVNWFLEKNIFGTVIFGKKYHKINHNIKLNQSDSKINKIIYKNSLLHSINHLPDNLSYLSIRFRIHKNFKIVLPEKLKYLYLNGMNINLTDYNIKDVGIINKKTTKDISSIIDSDLVYLNKYEQGVIDVNNLSTKIKILYLLDNFNEPINYLPDGIEKLVLGSSFSKSLSNIPNTIKTLELFYKYTNLDFINELHEYIENLKIDVKNINSINNYSLFENIKFPKSLLNLKFIIPRAFTRKKYEFEKILKYHINKNSLKFNILHEKLNI